jgi:hypothetical protein
VYTLPFHSFSLVYSCFMKRCWKIILCTNVACDQIVCKYITAIESPFMQKFSISFIVWNKRMRKERLQRDHLQYLQALSMILTSISNMRTTDIKTRVRFYIVELPYFIARQDGCPESYCHDPGVSVGITSQGNTLT